MTQTKQPPGRPANMPLSAQEQRVLDWVTRHRLGVLLETQVTASGLSRALDGLLARGLLEMCERPDVRERGGIPAAGVRLRR